MTKGIKEIIGFLKGFQSKKENESDINRGPLFMTCYASTIKSHTKPEYSAKTYEELLNLTDLSKKFEDVIKRDIRMMIEQGYIKKKSVSSHYFKDEPSKGYQNGVNIEKLVDSSKKEENLTEKEGGIFSKILSHTPKPIVALLTAFTLKLFHENTNCSSDFTHTPPSSKIVELKFGETHLNDYISTGIDKKKFKELLGLVNYLNSPEISSEKKEKFYELLKKGDPRAKKIARNYSTIHITPLLKNDSFLKVYNPQEISKNPYRTGYTDTKDISKIDLESTIITLLKENGINTPTVYTQGRMYNLNLMIQERIDGVEINKFISKNPENKKNIIKTATEQLAKIHYFLSKEIESYTPIFKKIKGEKKIEFFIDYEKIKESNHFEIKYKNYEIEYPFEKKERPMLDLGSKDRTSYEILPLTYNPYEQILTKEYENTYEDYINLFKNNFLDKIKNCLISIFPDNTQLDDTDREEKYVLEVKYPNKRLLTAAFSPITTELSGLESGIYIDANPANIIIDKNEKVYNVDFENIKGLPFQFDLTIFSAGLGLSNDEQTEIINCYLKSKSELEKKCFTDEEISSFHRGYNFVNILRNLTLAGNMQDYITEYGDEHALADQKRYIIQAKNAVERAINSEFMTKKDKEILKNFKQEFDNYEILYKKIN